MTPRKTIILLAIPVLLLGMAAGTWSWLLHSESGARWLFEKLQTSQSFTLGAASVSGDFGSGLHFDGLYFENESMRLDSTGLEIALNIDLIPPAVNLESLHSDSIVVRSLLVDGQANDEPANLRETVQGLSLPIPVHVHDVRLKHIEYTDSSGQRLVEIQSAEVSGAVHETLVLDGLTAEVKEHRLTLSGRLGLKPPHPLDMRFNTSGELTASGQLTGSLEQLQFEIENQAPAVQIAGSLQEVLATPEWDLELTSPGLQWPIDVPEPDAKIQGLSLQSSGQWSNYMLQIDGTLLLPGLEPVLMEIEGRGDNTAFSASQISLDGPEFALQSRAEISWLQDLALSLDATLERLNPATWISDWPGNQFVTGDLELDWSGDEIAVPRFELTVNDTPFLASGNGLYDLSSGIVDGQLSWNALSWPFEAPAPSFISDEGRFDVTGSPDDWRMSGALDIQAAGFPEGTFQLSGTGNLESLEMQIHEGAILGGFLAGEMAFNWTGNQPFGVSLEVRDIQTGALLEQYPGILNAKLAAGGQLEPLSVELDVQQLDGSIRQIPLNAGGEIHYDDAGIVADKLTIQSGSSVLTLDGNPYTSEGIELAAEIKSLAHFSDEMSGALSTRGRVSLLPDAPSMSGTLTAQQLTLGSIAIDRIETRQNEVVLTGLFFGESPMDSLILSFNSGEPLETLSMLATVGKRSISLELAGSVNDWSDPIGSGWKGALTDFELYRDQFSISLDEPAALELNGELFRLRDACLTGSRSAKLCMAASWESPDVIDFSTDLNAIPLSVLELFLDTDARFDQVLSGTFNWSQATGGDRSGNARIEVSPGGISAEGEDGYLVETGPGLFSFEVTNGRLKNGNLDFNFPQSGDIDVEFTAADLREGKNSPIQGNARVDLSDIGVIGKLTPVFDTIDGELDVDLALSGTISDPAFVGSASISNGKIENLASGFSFSEINISGEVNKIDKSFLTGSFRAGEGKGELNMNILFQDLLSPEIDFKLAGTNLTIIEVPDLKVIADPDLQLSWRDKTLEINGRLYIPAARLAPSYLPKASVGQSADVVVVAGELPMVKQDFLKENAIKMQGSLEVELGDEVVVDLDVAHIDVTGNARFNWRDELIPVANGSFNGTGDIQAFGQFLRVTQGRISFPDIPADNPHLNIRAEREIFGNSQIRRAGLMVAGTLKRPVVEAYTVPMTTKERAQTLLVTGSDFNYEQGVGAVDVGMYILPRLYVSYGIGVFEDGNVLKVRYDLGRGFGVQATSGQRESGMDISYTIER